MKVCDFTRSYFRFYIDFSTGKMKTLSHQPPTQTNQVRIMFEATCRLTRTGTDESTLYILSVPCKSEVVGGEKNHLWTFPNADLHFLLSDDEQMTIHKSWHKNDAGVMLVPESLGPQPERQKINWAENFDWLRIDLREVDATALSTYEEVAEAILGPRPLLSRIEYTDGDYDVCIDQPVKSINLAERDRLHQIDTGPILLPDLQRLESEPMPIGVFDLAYTAWHAPDWAEFVVNVPTPVADGVSVNHYSQPRHIEPTRNTLMAVE